MREFLRALDLEQWAALFEENAVDLPTLRVLTDDDLKELGLPFGPRKRILHALRSESTTTATTVGTAGTATHASPAPLTATASGAAPPATLASVAPAPSYAPPAPPPSDGATAVTATTPADAERRHLTVLFCDLVGYTALAGRLDPEVLQEVVRLYEDACAACITRYDGYVFQRLGDGVVAFFGFPLAHEDEAERAVRAGREIVEALARTPVPALGPTGRLQVRVGIGAGLVVVSAAQRSAVGEPMNLAARLQAVAEPGAVVVSDVVQRQTRGAFAWDDLGELALKGIVAPVRAWRVAGERDVATRFEAATLQALTPLVGRERELGVLLERWRQARDGEGQAVLVGGEPGIGKSRVVSALHERLDARGVEVLRFQCSPFHANSALRPWIELLERLIAGRGPAAVPRPSDDPAARLDRLVAHVGDALGRPLDEVRLLADLLGLPGESRWGAIALAPRRRRDATHQALVALVEAAARARPTLLVFEDAHWADPSSLEVLDLLLARLGTLPLLVLVTHRPEFGGRWGEHAHVTTLDVGRFTRDEARAVVARLAAASHAGSSLPESLVGAIVSRADGVPLYVEELARSVLESLEHAGPGADGPATGVHTTGGRTTGGHTTGGHTTGGHRSGSHDTPTRRATVALPVTVPATLRDSLMARLDRVPSVREVAQVGAVIGREFDHALVAAVLPLAPHALDAALDRLVESGLAFRRGRAPDATYTFKHALVQDAAYDSLLLSRRRELHRAIARALDARAPELRERSPEVLARHWAAAGADAEAAPLWRDAGRQALGRLALPEAIAHLDAGLALLPALPPDAGRDGLEVELRTLLGPALSALHGWGAVEVAETLEPAWALAEARGERGRFIPILHGLWVWYMSTARLAESLPWAERMLALGETLGDEGLALCGHRAAMTSRFWQGELAAALRHGDAVRALYDAGRHRHIGTLTNSDPLTGDGIYRAHYLWLLGHPDRARAASEATIAHARALGHPFDLAFALTLGAQVHAYRGDHAQLLACALEAERLGREHGVPLMSEMMAEITKGIGWLLAGRDAEGVPQLRAAIARLAGTGHRVWIAYLETLLGDALARLGDVARGLALADAALARTDCAEDRVHRPEALRLRGQMLAHAGHDDAAEAALVEALALARAQGAQGWALRAATTLAALRARRGDPAGARALLEPVHAGFTEGHDTADLQAARALLDRL